MRRLTPERIIFCNVSHCHCHLNVENSLSLLLRFFLLRSFFSIQDYYLSRMALNLRKDINFFNGITSGLRLVSLGEFGEIPCPHECICVAG